MKLRIKNAGLKRELRTYIVGNFRNRRRKRRRKRIIRWVRLIL